MNSMNDMVKVADLARELQKPAVVRRRLVRLGITPIIAPGVSPIGQRVPHQYITPEEADRIRASIVPGKRQPASRGSGSTKKSVFYMVAIPPGGTPPRYKVGWTSDMAGRLSEFTTLVPDAEVVALWDCHTPILEKAAIEVLKSLLARGRSVRHVANEVFEGDRDSILQKLDEFFAVSGLERIQ